MSLITRTILPLAPNISLPYNMSKVSISAGWPITMSYSHLHFGLRAASFVSSRIGSRSTSGGELAPRAGFRAGSPLFALSRAVYKKITRTNRNENVNSTY